MLLSCSNWTVPIIFDMDSILDRFRRDVMPLFSHMHGLLRNTFDIYLYPEVSRAIWEKKWWHFWPYWPVPSLMGSVLLRGEILKFFYQEPSWGRWACVQKTWLEIFINNYLEGSWRGVDVGKQIFGPPSSYYHNDDNNLYKYRRQNGRWRQVYEGDDMVTKFPCRWKIDGYGSQGWELEAA